VISTYVPKSDHGTSTEIIKAAMNKEQTRNRKTFKSWHTNNSYNHRSFQCL